MLCNECSRRRSHFGARCYSTVSPATAAPASGGNDALGAEIVGPSLRTGRDGAETPQAKLLLGQGPPSREKGGPRASS